MTARLPPRANAPLSLLRVPFGQSVNIVVVLPGAVFLHGRRNLRGNSAHVLADNFRNVAARLDARFKVLRQHLAGILFGGDAAFVSFCGQRSLLLPGKFDRQRDRGTLVRLTCDRRRAQSRQTSSPVQPRRLILCPGPHSPAPAAFSDGDPPSPALSCESLSIVANAGITLSSISIPASPQAPTYS